jgi:hypothetical protein
MTPKLYLVTNVEQKKALKILFLKAYFCLLPRQGSNLHFSDPESDVLPITPQGSLINQKNNFVDPMRVELTASRVRF